MNLYEKAFSKEISDTYRYIPNSSLLSFAKFTLDKFTNASHKDVLEIGCGAGHIFDHIETRLASAGLDLSSSAIDFASANSSAEFICGDFLKLENHRKWDFIFDSHLIHCLIGQKCFEQYLSTAQDLLRSGGILSIELMTRAKRPAFDEGYSFNEFDNCLYRGETPIRSIFDARNIEEMILNSGLKIVYLRVDETLKFIPNPNRSDSYPSDPDRMRIVCLKE
ncbi:hypothetical protein A9Q84_12625 [Halobacteriovorax marinus]|uniref:Methyltransferase domain-containing protein n=1 Tax=Halobacteriovorax marinus TaxID=97084 RepID=A0A1Y5F8T1_9BACT|nr:hypothetical protein A9Q84_12625 [Halobacteriovorax marinus]